MLVSIPFIFYHSLGIFSVAAAATTTRSPPPLPKTCPWSPSLQNLRPPACASPDFIRKLILPPSTPPTSTGWSDPENCVNNTCVFSNPAGGSALITSPRHARIIREYTFDCDTDEESGVDPPFFEEHMHGKGIGLLSNRSIAKGEILMVRNPTLVAQMDALAELEVGVRDMMYEIALSRLPKSSRDAFLAQMGRNIHDKIDTNSFQFFVHGAGEAGRGHLGCYPDVARLNHDCRPNVHYRITNATMTAVASRNIQQGEELTVSYIDVFLPSKERKERIRTWGFECGCALCRLPKNETAASDKRLHRINQLKADLNNFKEVKVNADTGAEYVALHEQEGLHGHLGSAYTRAALNSALFGDEARSKEYALRAGEELSLEKGPESGDARAMRVLAEDPRAHWTWGKRRKVEE
ncbi:hypothetical protein F4808DRAFT_459457 [Astrocystis sublimbata]|nr:hypothetical protein F4808DRAFT_459457 [Astrocystis sublimbata]